MKQKKITKGKKFPISDIVAVIIYKPLPPNLHDGSIALAEYILAYPLKLKTEARHLVKECQPFLQEQFPKLNKHVTETNPLPESADEKKISKWLSEISKTFGKSLTVQDAKIGANELAELHKKINWEGNVDILEAFGGKREDLEGEKNELER